MSAAEPAVFLCGTNDHGALGLALVDGAPAPLRVLSLRSHFVRCAAVGPSRSIISTGGGQLMAWGCGELPLPLDGMPSDCCALTSGPIQPSSSAH